MKKFLFLVSFICSYLGFSQDMVTVQGETLELKTEVEGKLDLLWNIIDDQYRYFVRTEDGSIQELKNTKEGKSYQEEYKTVLANLTQDSGLETKKLKLTLFSLKELISDYNALKDASFEGTERRKVGVGLAVFGGVTNQPFVENPNDELIPSFGFELEFFEKKNLPRHALFLNFRHEPDTDEFPYSQSQLALGYRFKFIKKKAFDFYINVKAATYTFSKTTLVDTNGMTYEESDSGLDAPFILGLGADIRLTKSLYFIIDYHNMYALFIDNHADFPIDILGGIKYEF